MLQQLKQLVNRIPIKLALVVFLLVIPIALLTFQFLTASNTNIQFAAKERQGLSYLKPVLEAFHGLLELRSKAAAGSSPEDAELQKRVDQALAQVADRELRLGRTLGTSEAQADLDRAWKAFAALPAETSADGRLAALDNSLRAATALIRRVGDGSNLILDPDLDSYYLISSLLVEIPRATQAASRLRADGARLLVAPNAPTSAERAALLLDVSDIQRSVEEFQKGLNAAFRANGRLQDQMAGAASGALREAASFAEATRAGIAEATTPSVRLEDHLRQGGDALGKLFELSETLRDQADQLLLARVNQTSAARNRRLWLSSLLAAAGLFGSLAIARGIVYQIAELTRVFRQVGGGRLDTRARAFSGDELGNAAGYLNNMLDNTRSLMQSQEERDSIQAAIMKLLSEVSDVAQGNLTAQAEVTPDMTGAIADAFNYMITELQGIIRQVQSTSREVNSTAGRVQETTELLARGSQQQALKIAQTSAVIEAMASSIQQVSQNAASASQVAQEALKSARGGASAVGRTMTGMNNIRNQVQETSRRIKRLGESSQEIGEIVQLISDIADRTSMLALNASIQAAAAGEAGRGFAVVAEEVERLAERSAEASKTIASLLKTIQTETSEAVAAMEGTTQEVVQGSNVAQEAGQALGQIEAVSNQLAQLIHSISQASSEQARGSEGAVAAMNQISQVTTQAAGGAQKAAASMRYLAQLADELASSMQRFRLPEQAA